MVVGMVETVKAKATGGGEKGGDGARVKCRETIPLRRHRRERQHFFFLMHV